MNSDRTQLRSIKTSDLVINGVGTFSISSFTVQHVLNRPAVIQVTCFPKAASDLIPIMTEGEKALNVYHDRAIKVIYEGAYQINCAFAVEQTTEGVTQSMEVTGVLGGSKPQLTKDGAAGIVFTIAHPLHTLATAQTGIYGNLTPPSTEYSVGESAAAKKVIEETTNVGDILLTVVNAWERYFERRVASVEPPAEKERQTSVHTAGQAGRDYFKTIIAENKAALATPFLPFINVKDRMAFATTIHQALTSSGDLLAGLLGGGGVGYQLGLVFSTQTKSSTGVTVRPLSVVGEPATRQLKSSYTNYSPSVGTSDGIPIRGVRMMTLGSYFTVAGTQLINGAIQPTTTFICYPPNVKLGVPKILDMSPPDWYQPMALQSGSDAGPAPAPIAKPEPSMRNLPAQHRAKQKEVRKYANDAQQMLLEWARVHYVYAALDTSTETLNIPLNFTAAELGEVLTVVSTGGTPLYDGFVAGVTHSVNLASNQANTTVQFTHVRTPGFRLPE